MSLTINRNHPSGKKWSSQINRIPRFSCPYEDCQMVGLPITATSIVNHGECPECGQPVEIKDSYIDDKTGKLIASAVIKS